MVGTGRRTGGPKMFHRGAAGETSGTGLVSARDLLRRWKTHTVLSIRASGWLGGSRRTWALRGEVRRDASHPPPSPVLPSGLGPPPLPSQRRDPACTRLYPRSRGLPPHAPSPRTCAGPPAPETTLLGPVDALRSASYPNPTDRLVTPLAGRRRERSGTDGRSAFPPRAGSVVAKPGVRR